MSLSFKSRIINERRHRFQSLQGYNCYDFSVYSFVTDGKSSRFVLVFSGLGICQPRIPWMGTDGIETWRRMSQICSHSRNPQLKQAFHSRSTWHSYLFRWGRRASHMTSLSAAGFGVGLSQRNRTGLTPWDAEAVHLWISACPSAKAIPPALL